MSPSAERPIDSTSSPAPVLSRPLVSAGFRLLDSTRRTARSVPASVPATLALFGVLQRHAIRLAGLCRLCRGDNPFRQRGTSKDQECPGQRFRFRLNLLRCQLPKLDIPTPSFLNAQEMNFSRAVERLRLTHWRGGVPMSDEKNHRPVMRNSSFAGRSQNIVAVIKIYLGAASRCNALRMVFAA